MTDDCVEVATVLGEGLRRHNYDVELAYDGPSALAICAEKKIALVLLDVLMPGIDGYEVCRRLKASPATRDIPVIFVTVKGSPQDIARGRELGAVDHITKPYNLPMVMLRVDAALRNKCLEDRFKIHDHALDNTMFTDHLTGLGTRGYFLSRLEEEVEKAHRHHVPVSCAVFDVDEVETSDGEGETAPMDDLLLEVAMIMRNQARTCDILARSDFSEFAAILPHADLDDAVVFASRIVDEVERTCFSHPGRPTEATLRAGIVACLDGVEHRPDHVFREAMCRLFEAKSHSTERIVARPLTAA